MWYLILPPVIIVAILAVLIYIFSKRFPKAEHDARIAADGNMPDFYEGSSIVGAAREVLLHILEKIARWSKIVTLRLHNSLHGWTQSLREKKGKRRATKKIAVSLGNEALARPMVSHEVTHPDNDFDELKVPASKNQFEDILVERIAANPRDIEAYERLGEYYMEQGNTQDAKECYRQVLRLSPVHRLAKIKIRRLEKMLEQKEKKW